LGKIIYERWGLHRTKNKIGEIKMMFKFAYDNDLIEKPVKFGTGFKPPSREAFADERNNKPERLFQPKQLHDILLAASPTMRAMLYLGLNSGMGNKDAALLTRDHIKGDWIDYPRRKNGRPCRFCLWPETKLAIHAVLKNWKAPKLPFEIRLKKQVIESGDRIFYQVWEELVQGSL